MHVNTMRSMHWRTDMCSATSDVRFGPEADMLPILLDNLISALLERYRDIEAECLRSLEVDHQLVFRRHLHRHIVGFLPFEDAIHVTSGEAVLVTPIRSVSDQAASGREVALGVYRWQLVPRCEGNDKIAIVPSGRAPRHDQTAIRRSREGRYSAFDLTSLAQVDRVYLHPEQWRHGLDDGKIADSRPLAGIPEDRHLRDPRRNFFE